MLFGGAALYGKLCEKVFGPDDRKTPAYTKNDGVDYVPMKGWKNSLINLLNIAGTGPILGPIQGILFGPIAFITIPIGNVIGGAMHDYFSGMICLRDGGTQMPDMVKRYTNKGIFTVYNIFVCLLLLLVGAVFIYTPGDIAATQVFNFSGAANATSTWVIYGVIFAYYLIATVFPIDKIIGRIYPVFGFALLFMAVGILVVLLFGGEYTIPEFTSFENCIADAKAFPIVPMLFTTIACGAISGFHATQSPLMARCMRNERESRSVFYGAMISESIIALVWAAIAMAFWGDVAGLNGAIAEYGGQAAVMIDVIANKTLGPALAVFVIFGVVACAITSGDTAFRSARLIVADFMGVEQRTLRKRIYICIPLFALGLLIIFGLPFQTMWSYFAWMNQTLAAVTLWMIVAYLRHRGRAVWVGLIPALVMTYVCASYIFVSPLMLGMQNRTAAYLLGGGVTLAVLVAMIFKLKDNDAKGIS